MIGNPPLSTNTELCPRKDVCGSCGWSHIPYEKQLKQKLADINSSFRLKDLEYSCESILPSPVTSHYRNRMDFVISFQGEVGLRQKGKWWRVIDDHSCFIADPIIDEKFKIVRSWVKEAGLSYFDRKSHIGVLRYAVIRATTLGQSMITIVTSTPLEESRDTIVGELNRLAKESGATTLIWAINPTVTDVSSGSILSTISGDGWIEEVVNGFYYRITADAFFQTNSHAARLLQERVIEIVKEVTPSTLLDLYCGAGFFSVALSRYAKQTIGIEVVPTMIEDARLNAARNQSRVNYQVAKAEASDWRDLGADLIVLDPPRSGLHDRVIKDITEAKPQNIVYVSCNYKSFAREMAELRNIYNVDSLTAIDMFPHTPHVELVSLLTRRL